jgi:hypothetical protein
MFDIAAEEVALTGVGGSPEEAEAAAAALLLALEDEADPLRSAIAI